MFTITFSKSMVRWVAASLVVGSLISISLAGFSPTALAAGTGPCQTNQVEKHIDASGTATVKNLSDQDCTFYLASYEINYHEGGTWPFINWQTLHSSDSITLGAGETGTLSTSVPDACEYQLDLVNIPPITPPNYAPGYFLGVQYGGPSGVYCNAQPPVEQHNPAANIKANGSDAPISIAYNTPAQISWTSNDVTACTVTPGNWNTLSGSQSSGNLTSSVTYTINCSGPYGSATDSVTVNVQPQNQCIAPVATTATATNVTQTSAQLRGTVNPNGNATTVYFEYGTTSNFGQRTADQSFSGSGSVSVSANISNLQANTTYYFRLVAVNSCGGAAINGSTLTFVTTANQTPTAEIRANNQRGSITIAYNTPATITWTSTHTTACTVSPTGWSGTTGTQSTGNLTSSQTYVLNCTGENGQNLTDSVTVNVGTQQCIAPTLTTQAATYVGQNSATLNGTVTLSEARSTTVRFEYGTTTSFGQWTTTQNFNTAGTFNVSLAISNLQPNTTYYFRLTATNSCGDPSTGGTLSFTTPGTGGGNTPSVQIFANEQRGVVQVQYNTSAQIRWASQYTSSCTISPTGWGGTSGSNNSGNITGTVVYTANCIGTNGQSVSDSVTVQTSGVNNQLPTVSIYANPNSITNGQSSVLTWYSSNANYCYASAGPWSGTKSLSGSETVYPNITSSYTITCQNSYGSASAIASVFVNGTSGNGSLQVTKLVRNITLNQTSFQQNVEAQGNDTLEFEIRVRNNDTFGRTITVQDILPQELYYVPNSTTVNGVSVIDGITTNGLSLGWVNPNEEKIVRFRTTVFTGATDRTITNQANANGTGGSTNAYIYGNAYATVQLRNRGGQVLGVSDVVTGSDDANALGMAIMIGFAAALALFFAAKQRGWLDLLPAQYGGKRTIHDVLAELSAKANAAHKAGLK